MKKYNLILALLSSSLLGDNTSSFEKFGISTSANIGITSHYIWRGMSQVGGDDAESNLAIQGGFDFSHKSGLYLGTWASSLENGMEQDLYLGFANNFQGIDYDISYLEYMYPYSKKDIDFGEVIISLGYNYSNIDFGVTMAQDFDNETTYTEISAGYSYNIFNFSISAGDYIIDDDDDYGSNIMGTVSTTIDKFDIGLSFYTYSPADSNNEDDDGIFVTISTSI
jgi:uncharacterized protein (TIGR02001 family)